MSHLPFALYSKFEFDLSTSRHGEERTSHFSAGGGSKKLDKFQGVKLSPFFYILVRQMFMLSSFHEGLYTSQ